MTTIIVFDLDGTLVDSAPTIMAVANTVAKELDLAPLTRAETVSYIGRGADIFVRQMLDARGAGGRFDEAVALFRAIYETTPTHASTPMPGASRALLELADAGHALGLCTNKPTRPTELELEALGWQGRFEAVVCGDTLATRKPDPAPLRHVIERLGIGSAVYVGDSETDAATADAAGVPFLLFTEGYRKAPISELPHAATFDDFGKLTDLIADELSQ